jgi:hypothetical protein
MIQGAAKVEASRAFSFASHAKRLEINPPPRIFSRTIFRPCP